MVDTNKDYWVRRTESGMGSNETVPVCLAIDNIRPASPAEALAHLYMHGHRLKEDFEVCPDEEQVRYVNEMSPRGQSSNEPLGEAAMPIGGGPHGSEGPETPMEDELGVSATRGWRQAGSN